MLQFVMTMKLKKLFYSLVACLFSSVLLLFLYQVQINTNFWSEVSINELPKIIWWTPFTLRNKLELIQCGDFKCAISDNRTYNDTAAFLFYASNFMANDLPLPRKSHHVWGLLHEESPKNLPLILHDSALDLFNFSSTFSRHSDSPLTLQYLPSFELLTNFQYYVSTNEKDSYSNRLAPILYIQSDCQTPLERDSYVSELMKYIQVDSYGKCLNNKKLPENLTRNPLENLYSDEFMHFVAQYKFTIAFENAVCEDYITEKLWRPIIVGSVPIYIGSPSVTDWLPNGEKSVILVNKFKSPKKLAEYIYKLNKDRYLYENYLQHKLSDYFKVTNEKLKNSLTTVQKNAERHEHFFHDFECRVCESIHLKVRKPSLNRNEYDCPAPVSPLTGEKNNSNWWNNVWKEGRCHSILVHNIIEDQLNITKEEYDRMIQKMIGDKLC